MIRISQLKMPIPHTQDELKEKLIRALQIKPEELNSFAIRRQSLDARKKPQLFYVYTIDAEVLHEEEILHAFSDSRQKPKSGKSKAASGRKHPANLTVSTAPETVYRCPKPGSTPLRRRPVVVGSGPAGLFCAYLLAENGYAPLVLERGAPAGERKKDVETFWKTGVLKPESNVQFGEGGAGTFSDGKLNTLVKDKSGRNRLVLETFVRFGAPEDILYSHKPHIGTDLLIRIVENMRNEIVRLGGEVRFHTCLTDIDIERQIVTSAGPGGENQEFLTDVLVLAPGHSARDTFAMLNRQHISMEAKSFAVGVRIEHPQEMIDRAQYGRARGDILPPASYKLAENNVGRAGRNVYTFCMCPGGYVVNASSEAGRLAVNGMSYRGRDGQNANSAVIASVTPADFGQPHPLAGVEFQRRLERKAFLAAMGKIPVQRFADFQKNVPTIAFGKIKPAAKGEAAPANVRGIFTPDLAESLEEGILRMDRKIAGFAGDDVLLSGVESRTSSPVRILRTDEMVSPDASWIYPCGEGAGYAGGITSAAMDGIRIAEAVIQKFRPAARNA